MFSPPDLVAEEVVQGERPYAGLWSITGARLAVANDGRRVQFASFTIGVLGLPLTEALHRGVHSLVGDETPQGYDHEISDGGEPTAKLTYASRTLRAGDGLGRGGDVWTTWSASAGYLTEASVSLVGRWGERAFPWWAASPELADYSPAPSFGVLPLGRELTLDAGVRARLRVYNAFVRGQFRHGDVRYSNDEVESVVGEAWLGLTYTFGSGMTLRYSLRAETAELKHGPAARGHVWGSLLLSHAF